jgi:flagellin
MGLRINTNVASTVAQHRLELNRDKLSATQDRLASGSRILKSMDDAAGLAISEQQRATIKSTEQNIKEAHNGMFMLQTADGALNYVTNMVVRMKELATAAASDTNGDKERSYLDNEAQALKGEIDRISRSTIFNGRPLLTGETSGIEIQVGPHNQDDVDRIRVAADFEVNTGTLGLSSLDLSSAAGAREALDPLHEALDRIASVRGSIGATESALTSTIQNLMQYDENISGAFSQIRDADIAFESAELAKYNILTNAGVAVLAQANNTPQLALKLLS